MNLIQEKNISQHTAQRSDLDLRAVVDISPYPVFIHNNGVVKYANQLTRKLIKQDPETFNSSWNVGKYIHPADLPQVREEMSRYGATDPSHVLKIRIIDSEGTTHHVQGKSIPISYGGEICRLVHLYNFDHAEQAIETAKEKEILLETLIKTIPDSILVVNSATRKILYSNNSFLEHLGYDATDLIGTDEYKLIISRIHPEDIDKVLAGRDTINDPENSGLFVTIEYRILDKASKWRRILGRSCNIRPTQGSEGGINFGIIQDITEVKENEQALIDYRAFQEKVNNASPALITIFDLAAMTSTYHSKNMMEWFKHIPDTFPARTFDLIHPEYQKEAFDSVHRVAGLREGEVQTTIFPYMQGDGSLKFVLTRSTIFQRDESGKVTHTLMVHSDVTDLKEVESRLDRSEETRKAILYAIPDMVMILDRGGFIVDFYPNEILRAAMQSLDLTGKNIKDLVTPENSFKLQSAIDIAMKQDRLHTANFEHKGDDRTYSLEVRLSKFSEDKVIIVARDISDQKKSQDKIDHFNKELIEKNQELERYITSNSELEKFAYIASHDLREPLRSLTGFAQLLQKRNEGKLTRESEEFIENIIHGAQRMNTLVSGLLEYSRITSAGKPFTQVVITDLIKKVRSDLKISIEENKAEILLFDMPELYCDELQMRQLFQNLISNALKFRSEHNPLIKIYAEKSERHWLFKIEDNGIGIDMRYKDQVFQIFTRLHSQDKYQGSGIGLSVCKKIIERHGGQIWLESTPGRGTTMLFTVLI